MKVLFVCSQARMRSYTARNLCIMGGMDAECAGTDSSARLPLNNALLLDADLVICFMKEHKKKVLSLMGSEGKRVYCVNIPDIYNPYDAELVYTLAHALRNLACDEVADALLDGFNRRKS